MAQGADGAFEHSLVEDPRPESGAGSLRWLALPVLLAVGWGAFFSLSAVFLADDPPSRVESAFGGVEPQTALSAFVMIPEPRKAGFTTTAWREPPPQPEPTAVSKVEPPVADGAAPARTASLGAQPDAVVAPAIAAAPRSGPDSAEFVGVWGPTQAACQAPSRRRGYIPATITLGGAKAGRTVCSFKDSRRAGNAWTMAASCSERGRRWSSQVRLVVDGNRLTWSSGKGDAAYVRCARREG